MCRRLWSQDIFTQDGFDMMYVTIQQICTNNILQNYDTFIIIVQLKWEYQHVKVEWLTVPYRLEIYNFNWHTHEATPTFPQSESSSKSKKNSHV